MSLQLYNTLSGKKDVFVPINPDHVTLYVCGPTVYNRVHIGNARAFVTFDTLYRLLSLLYPRVTYARNITDIDDKIMAAAVETNQPIKHITEQYTQAFFEDMATLNNLEPTLIPFATDHVQDMIQLTETLIEKGHAYVSQGHVLFDVKSMPDYGKLSNRSLEDMLAGARVEVADYKRYAGDFVLWKPSLANEPAWPSPWGDGRPGWHLECSAMIKKHLGDSIDIHGGGRDLVFPHHENEIAQSECAHGKEFVRYWMHNGYVNIDGDKMSKSLGNFRMVNELLTTYPGEVLRFALLSAHYRSELNFSEALLIQAKSVMDSLYSYRQAVEDVVADPSFDLKQSKAFKALLDDMNTPVAISELHRLGKAMKQAKGEEASMLKAEFLAIADFLGLLQQSTAEWFQAGAEDGMPEAEVEALIANMKAARAEKDYDAADRIRQTLQDAGIQLLRDGWRRG